VRPLHFMRVIKIIFFISVVLCGAIAGPVCGQELRKPTKITEVVVKSTYPVRIDAVINADDKLYVWIDYHNIFKSDPEAGYHRSGFSAKKLQVYEGNRLESETTDLKAMPDPLSVGNYGWIRKGVGSLPHSEDGDNRITVFSQPENTLTKLGFAKDKLVLGPFDYRVNSAWPIGRDEKGFMYVSSYCSNTEEQRKKRGGWEPFAALYVLNRELRLIDSFIYNKTEESDPLEILPTSGGPVFLSKSGNFYSLEWEQPAKTIKIKVRKWTIGKFNGNYAPKAI